MEWLSWKLASIQQFCGDGIWIRIGEFAVNWWRFVMIDWGVFCSFLDEFWWLWKLNDEDSGGLWWLKVVEEVS
jgi:hypothetical protein